MEIIEEFEEKVINGERHFSNLKLEGFSAVDVNFIIDAICKKHGKQSQFRIDSTAFEVFPATKKFMSGKGSYKNRPKNRVLLFLEQYEENRKAR